LWDESEPAPLPPGWNWTPDKHLVDYIHVLEDQLGITRTPAPEPAADATVQPDEPKPAVEEAAGASSEETP